MNKVYVAMFTAVDGNRIVAIAATKERAWEELCTWVDKAVWQGMKAEPVYPQLTWTREGEYSFVRHFEDELPDEYDDRLIVKEWKVLE